MAKSSWSHALVWASLAGALAGCSSIPDSHAPASPRIASPLSNADGGSGEPVPRIEPPSRSGNPDTYVVFGRRYRVKETSEGYREQGVASWYGWDFHGRKTSSGPRYNMFDLTAAHKSLPIPTYVRVANLENGRNVVVKVNDRGPFVGRRIIDLSYAAADRLGMLKQGTARVEVTALEPYQFLPGLAARRAETRERLASRQSRPEPATEPAEPAAIAAAAPETGSLLEPTAASAEPPSIHFAREAPIRLAAGGKPPVRLAAAATVERRTSRTRAPTRPTLAAARTAPNSAMRPATAKSSIKPREPDRIGSPIRLASAAPMLKGKGAVEDRRVSTAASNRNGRLNPTGTAAERRDARPSNGRSIDSARRDSRKESGSGDRREARKPANNPGAAKQAAVRLASLKTNRSRIATD